MIQARMCVVDAKVAILGITFKENCPDIRNSKVVTIIERLREFGMEPKVSDPWANREKTEQEYGIKLEAFDALKDIDCIIIAVAHNEFKNMSAKDICSLY